MPAAITPGSRYDYRRHRWNDWLAAIRPWDGDALIQCAAYCARRKITSNHPLALAEAEDTGGLLEDEWARRHGAYSYYQRSAHHAVPCDTFRCGEDIVDHTPPQSSLGHGEDGTVPEPRNGPPGFRGRHFTG